MEELMENNGSETTKFQIKNKKLREGAVLLQSAKENQSLYLLREGSVEFLKSDLDVATNPAPKVLQSASRVSVTEGESLFANAQIINNSDEPIIVRALEDCIISIIEVKGRFGEFITENPKIGIKLVEFLLKRRNEVIELLMQINNLILQVQLANDNCAVGYYIVEPELSQGKKKPNTMDNPLLAYSYQIATQLSQSKSFPEKIDSGFLTNDDVCKALKKSYGVKENLVNESDDEIKELIEKILSVEGPILNQFMYAEPSLIVLMCTTLSKHVERLVDKVVNYTRILEKAFSTLAGKDQSWISEVIELNERAKTDKNIDEAQLNSFLKEIVNMIETVNSEYFGIYGKEYVGLSSKYKAIEAKYEAEKKSVSIETRRKKRDEAIVFPEELKNSLDQIVDYAELPEEDKDRFLKEYMKFKKLKNRFDTALEFARIRKRITQVYWKLYERTYLKYKKVGHMPKASEMLIRFGYLDEELCSDEDVFDLYRLADDSKTEYPFHQIIEWLDGIYSKEIYPSISEFGETFRQLRKRELSKDYNPDEEQQYNTEMFELLTTFEIENAVKLASVIVSGNPRAAFPIFCSELLVRGDVNSAFVTKEKMEAVLKQILDVDFSAFHREVIYRANDKNVEFPRKSVIPNFIILPVIGSRIQLWQVMEGTNKSSRGRIMVPAFLVEDLDDAVLRSVGGFRYELSKEIAGANWMHPVDGGLAGAYYDYMTYYKKNPRLSMEAKEKIEADFKRFRTTRDRFINDYYYWMKYEKEGILRLNKVTRELFYRSVPFRKEIRDRLSTFPAYEEIHTRFTNVQRRTMANLKAKYHKYSKDGGELPKELQENLEYYDV